LSLDAIVCIVYHISLTLTVEKSTFCGIKNGEVACANLAKNSALFAAVQTHHPSVELIGSITTSRRMV
jgi:hypothetical protein